MTDEADSPATEAMPAVLAPAPAQVPASPGMPSWPAEADTLGAPAQPPADRPELIVIGAFAAGFLIALIIKRLGR